MNTSKKCSQCGLVNFATDDFCRRCSWDLNAPAPLPPLSHPPKSKSTLYVGLFVMAAIGFGGWAYWYKTGSDRELKAKAEFYGRQNAAPASTPRPLFDEQMIKKMNEDNEKMKRAYQEWQNPRNVPVPSPIVRP
jgi:hypothetical protein